MENPLISKSENSKSGVRKRIFVTGGAGFIGSHTSLQLIENGYDIIIFDNFSNSKLAIIDRLQTLTGKKIEYVKGDVRDFDHLKNTLEQSKCEAVIHFAGLKSVGESVEMPLNYYDNNVVASYNLVRAMQQTNTKELVFSSSATVYGRPQFLPITEDHPLSAENPYGQTKLIVENMLRDVAQSDPSWRIAILRYFNPCGAHTSGLIGEDPKGIPNNLVPFIAQVAIGLRSHVNVMGNDYDTPDGTGVRDYIHVVDLANGHVKALDYLEENVGCKAFNLGTGTGYSVLEMINAFSTAADRDILFKFTNRRKGDVATCFANTQLASKVLGWKAILDLNKMCVDHWNWQSKNPEGYS